MKTTNRRGPSLLVIGLGTAIAACLFVSLAVILARSSRPQPTPMPSDPIASVVVVKGSLKCEEWTDDSARVTGRVQNTGTVDTTSIEVVVIATDGSREVARNRTYADDGRLGRGQISGFTGFVTTSGATWDGCRALIGDVR